METLKSDETRQAQFEIFGVETTSQTKIAKAMI